MFSPNRRLHIASSLTIYVLFNVESSNCIICYAAWFWSVHWKQFLLKLYSQEPVGHYPGNHHQSCVNFMNLQKNSERSPKLQTSILNHESFQLHHHVSRLLPSMKPLLQLFMPLCIYLVTQISSKIINLTPI